MFKGVEYVEEEYIILSDSELNESGSESEVLDDIDEENGTFIWKNQKRCIL